MELRLSKEGLYHMFHEKLEKILPRELIDEVGDDLIRVTVETETEIIEDVQDINFFVRLNLQ